MTAIEKFEAALKAWGRNDIVEALRLTEDAAVHEPASLVYREAAVYLQRVLRDGKPGVYVSPDGFSAFIRGGGNVGLYANTSNELRTAYEEYASLSLLDIGVGDGLALLPALTPNIHQLDVVEPSAAMLPNTRLRLDELGVHHRAFNGTVQELIAQKPFGSLEWDVIEATFSLQSVPPEERPQVFGWLSENGRRVLMAEFDTPVFADPFAPEWVKYVVERYEKGLAEYERGAGRDGEDTELDIDRENLVAQGFLMPVMFGYFDTGAARTNWENPIVDWIDLLKDAGFSKVEAKLIYPYWWGNAFMIDAS
jgi:hypothetical protein